MPRYLIELPHDDEREACIRALRSIDRYGSHLLTNLDWGCEDGTHCGWFVVELDSRDEAMHLVPPEFRHTARIVQLNKFTKERIGSLIAELEA